MAVHHSAGVNNYSEADVPRIIRGIYQHAVATGFSDIQYNLVVDRFGRTWEGRAGGVDKPVKGGHTGGFNNNTSGTVALGNFDTVDAPAPMIDALAKVAAWKLSLHGVDALASATLYSEGLVGTSRYPAGTAVRLPTIFAHRQTGLTACPGRYIFADMDAIRTKAKAHQTVVVVTPPPALVNPAQSVATAAYPNTTVTLRAGVTTTQDWRLDVVQEGCTGGVTRTLTGTATPATGLKATWDGKDATGAPARPGTYKLTLSSWAGAKTAKPYVTSVEVGAPTPGALRPPPRSSATARSCRWPRRPASSTPAPAPPWRSAPGAASTCRCSAPPVCPPRASPRSPST
ncbi:MAG: N-acetylmuramoyl-L-alanine amidase [Actinomycetota bacterium]|nr:N-acetylmuramoyl-L-alanine amidase [Actinomycetota bacterium]